MKYYLNIGSNLGDCRLNLQHAIEMLENSLQAKSEISSIVESVAWGYESKNIFHNVGIMIESNISPQEMLLIAQHTEKMLGSTSHRNADGSYCDRIVDIDIIAIDEQVIDSESLTVPHPRMHLRDFVLRPMAELAPLWTHPILHKTATQLLQELQNSI